MKNQRNVPQQRAEKEKVCVSWSNRLEQLRIKWLISAPRESFQEFKGAGHSCVQSSPVSIPRDIEYFSDLK